MGRPTKLTPERHKQIVDLVRAGNYPEIAAQAAGINAATYYRWMQKGEDGTAPYGEFREAIKEAQGTAEAHAVAIIRKAALDGTWQAAAWFLERSKAERWRRKENVELTGKDGGPVRQQVVGDEQRAEVTALIDELAARRAKQDAA